MFPRKKNGPEAENIFKPAYNSQFLREAVWF